MSVYQDIILGCLILHLLTIVFIMSTWLKKPSVANMQEV